MDAPKRIGKYELEEFLGGGMSHVHVYRARDTVIGHTIAIKPENVHIQTGGTVKLVDFGIAKTQDLSLTQPGLTMGTPYYMAPEQVTAKDVT